MSTFSSISNAILDFIYPPYCVICKAPGTYFCDACQSKSDLITSPLCPRCGYPLPDANQPCHECQLHPLKSLDSIRSAAFFESGSLRDIIHKFKYNDLYILGKSLASMLATCYTINQMKADIIVPVPLHKSRLKERGYNQSAILAKELARRLQLPVEEKILVRFRKTQSQMSLNANDRQNNVANAFSCRNDLLTAKSVLLIDDVCTTGATLDACATALKASGAKAVHGLTVARAS